MQYFPNTEPPDMERVQTIVDKQLNHWDEQNLG